MKGVCCVAAAVTAFSFAPGASAGRSVSVGYRTLSALHGLKVVSRIATLRIAEVRLPNVRAERTLRMRPGIRFVQHTVSRVDTGGPILPFSTGTSVPEWQWAAVHADLVPAWVQQAARSITIAVIDTGADTTAPILAAKSPATWNVIGNSTAVHDAVGHGTFVASLAAGSTADASAMTGFGGDARLLIVQANRTGSNFSDVDEAAAITYAANNGANIINLSLGGAQSSFVERNAIDYATQRGILLVAAAGNSAEQGNPTVYPAALLGKSGLAVGAANALGDRASFSTTGSWVDVLAPGVDVLGALAGGTSANFFTPTVTPGAQGSYGFGSGTSYATPEVAGSAALVWAANPKLDAAGVAAMIEATASGQGTWSRELAFGNIDVASAVQRATGGVPPQLVRPTVTPKPRPQHAKFRTATKRAKARRPRP